ncbi:MAG: hypothetical protein WC436_00435 [Candidatus Babeliales bacterium]
MSINKIIFIFIVLFYSSSDYIFAVKPPKYLKEIKFEQGDVSAEDTKKALELLKNGTIIALRSREIGGYLFANDQYFDNQVLSAFIERSGGSLYLGYSYTTPDVTRFVIVRKGDFIGLKSLFFEGNFLVAEKKFPEFKKTTISNHDAQWYLECTHRLKQLFLRSSRDTYLSVKSKSRMMGESEGKKIIRRDVTLESVSVPGREQAFELVILN